MTCSTGALQAGTERRRDFNQSGFDTRDTCAERLIHENLRSEIRADARHLTAMRRHGFRRHA